MTQFLRIAFLLMAVSYAVFGSRLGGAVHTVLLVSTLVLLAALIIQELRDKAARGPQHAGDT